MFKPISSEFKTFLIIKLGHYNTLIYFGFSDHLVRIINEVPMLPLTFALNLKTSTAKPTPSHEFNTKHEILTYIRPKRAADTLTIAGILHNPVADGRSESLPKI